jgi:membrane protein implicated in regulation of membrane protease activity
VELYVAVWSARLASVAALAVGAISLSVGTPPLDAVLRAVAAALAFTIGGQYVMTRIESPDRRMRRLMARRARKRDKA